MEHSTFTRPNWITNNHQQNIGVSSLAIDINYHFWDIISTQSLYVENGIYRFRGN